MYLKPTLRTSHFLEDGEAEITMNGRCIRQCLTTMVIPPTEEVEGTMLEETMDITMGTQVVVVVISSVGAAAVVVPTEGAVTRALCPEDQVSVNTWSLYLLNFQSGFHQSIKSQVVKIKITAKIFSFFC